MSRRRTFLMIGLMFNLIGLYWIFLAIASGDRLYFGMCSFFMFVAAGFYVTSVVAKPD